MTKCQSLTCVGCAATPLLWLAVGCGPSVSKLEADRVAGGVAPQDQVAGEPDEKTPDIEPTDRRREAIDPLAMHRVEKQDTLFSLAKQYYADGSRWPLIVQANAGSIVGPEDLSVGQVLVIPRQESAALGDAGGDLAPDPVELPTQHTIQPGDTMYSLAVRYYGRGSFSYRIVEANQERIPNVNDLQIGEKLVIPVLFAESIDTTVVGQTGASGL